MIGVTSYPNQVRAPDWSIIIISYPNLTNRSSRLFILLVANSRLQSSMHFFRDIKAKYY